MAGPARRLAQAGVGSADLIASDESGRVLQVVGSDTDIRGF